MIMESVFTKIINKEVPARIVWENDDVICIIPKHHFVNPGHLLIIPKIQVDYLFDLEDEIYHKLWKTAKEIAIPLKKVTDARRIGIAVEGFSVLHAHIHLCPVNGVAELDPFRDAYWSESERDEFLEAMKKELEGITI
jgi:histidine triad (HIT) family protein